MLHEFIAADPNEDAALSSGAAGQMPAAIRTPSGTVTPPNARTSPEPSSVYDRASSQNAAFRPDRDTSRPRVERYEDPFSPSLTPFKRMTAYDAVRADYTLYVRDPQLRKIVPGEEAQDGDDRFFSDMVVQLEAGEDIRIPTVGPQARLLTVTASPRSDISFWRDGADNWFLRGSSPGRVRLVTELAIDRANFASGYDDTRWADLPQLPPQPQAHRRAYRRVARAIGISRRMRPRKVVDKMVTYFRSFEPSDAPPNAHRDIYLDLALSRKGVCRHRSFAFLVTALNVGIPTRLVHNEAHAWVEVRDKNRWHRIDLGGAALNLADEPRLDRPPHVPPPDQFEWPTGRDSGSDLAHRERQAALANAQNSSDPSDADPAVDPNAPADPNAAPDPNLPPATSQGLPDTTLTIDNIDRDIFRGLPVRISGTARAEGKACVNMRVDVLLLVEGEVERQLGSLATNARGVYDGEVVVPAAIPIGDHELVVATVGNQRCGLGQVR
ncbi:MAG TPA: transglutaminase domain-containing protein [Sorangium sp.]|nr:transglutaminase domain-containing protein [Sorangium sp.]